VILALEGRCSKAQGESSNPGFGSQSRIGSKDSLRQKFPRVRRLTLGFTATPFQGYEQTQAEMNLIPRMRTIILSFCILLLAASALRADPPVSMYLFPAGGERGKTVNVLAGGLFLNKTCNFEILGKGVTGPSVVHRTTSSFFEGPVLPLPESQRQQDYPRAMAAQIKIAPDAPVGPKYARLWTSQGVTALQPFIVGDLPEIVEEEIDGSPIPILVNPPVTINGRIYPHEDIDIWTVRLKKGQPLTCSVAAVSLGSPLDAYLEIRDAKGRKLVESRNGLKSDPKLSFTPSEDGDYQVHISDIRSDGGPAFVYRLTLTTGAAVDHIFPLGGKRGEKTRFEFSGIGIPTGTSDVAIPTSAGSTFATRLPPGTNDVILDADGLTEVRESNEQSDPARANFLPVPAVGNGRIAHPGDTGFWNIAARKGENFDVELRAHRLGSPLLGVLTVSDAAGKELVRTEAGPTGDPSLHFTAPADGSYRIAVQDRFSNRGRPAFAYRLRVDRASPGFVLQFAQPSITLVRGKPAAVKVNVTRHGNLTAPIQLMLEGLPPGVTTASPPVIAPNQATYDISLKTEETAKIQSFTLVVKGTAYQPLLPYTAMPIAITNKAVFATSGEPLDHVRVAVAIPTPFKIAGDYNSQLIPRGTLYARHFRIERKGFAGPIEIETADKQARHLQGAGGPPMTVAGDKTEFDYIVQLPPWMETGRTCRVCVMGTATVKDADGSEHVVTYTSQEQNDQIIAVVEPERLSLDLDRQTIRVEPGSEVQLGIKIARGVGLSEPALVEVEVPANFKGIDAARLELPGSAGDGKLRIRFSKEAIGPFNMPLTVRAVVKDKGLPVTAEAKVELVPAR